MIESEVKIYDNNINLSPIDVENKSPVINLPFEPLEITSHFEEVKIECANRFAKKRKFRRVKSAGIF